MKPITQEWVDKAEEDWNLALMSYRARKHPSYNGAVFHCQQAAEKYLKSRLEEAGMIIPKTHDLILLLRDACIVEPAWKILQPHLLLLNPYSVAFRYPGATATKLAAKEAIQNCRIVRQVVRKAFGLPV
ncbi:MAG TPA: HEPN domain-containing protein [Blastocatellia bacterium]|nr:HEPN domain-containing protein [Blastocatellia bacterium]